MLTLDSAGLVCEANQRARLLMDDEDLVGKRMRECLAEASRSEFSQALLDPAGPLAQPGVDVGLATRCSGTRTLRVDVRLRPPGQHHG